MTLQPAGQADAVIPGIKMPAGAARKIPASDENSFARVLEKAGHKEQAAPGEKADVRQGDAKQANIKRASIGPTDVKQTGAVDEKEEKSKTRSNKTSTPDAEAAAVSEEVPVSIPAGTVVANTLPAQVAAPETAVAVDPKQVESTEEVAVGTAQAVVTPQLSAPAPAVVAAAGDAIPSSTETVLREWPSSGTDAGKQATESPTAIPYPGEHANSSANETPWKAGAVADIAVTGLHTMEIPPQAVPAQETNPSPSAETVPARDAECTATLNAAAASVQGVNDIVSPAAKYPTAAAAAFAPRKAQAERSTSAKNAVPAPAAKDDALSRSPHPSPAEVRTEEENAPTPADLVSTRLPSSAPPQAHEFVSPTRGHHVANSCETLSPVPEKTSDKPAAANVSHDPQPLPTNRQPAAAENGPAVPATETTVSNSPRLTASMPVNAPAVVSSSTTSSPVHGAVPPPPSADLPSPSPRVPAHAEPPANEPVAPPIPASGPIQAARLVDQLGQAEMHIGLRTLAFGAVEVHTAVRGSEVGVSVGSEKGDLRGWLANEVPALEGRLGQHDLRLESVRFLQPNLSCDTGAFAQSDSSSRSFSQGRTYSAKFSALDEPEPAASVLETVFHRRAGLDVRA